MIKTNIEYISTVLLKSFELNSANDIDNGVTNVEKLPDSICFIISDTLIFFISKNAIVQISEPRKPKNTKPKADTSSSAKIKFSGSLFPVAKPKTTCVKPITTDQAIKEIIIELKTLKYTFIVKPYTYT